MENRNFCSALIIFWLSLSNFFCAIKAESPFYPYWPRTRYQAQSFMYTRPLAQNIALQQALWHSIAYDKHGCHCAGFQIYPVYQKAIAEKKNNYYFLFDCKSELLVSGDENVNDLYIRDVRAEWLQLPSNFRGKMTICPRQCQSGVICEYHHDVEHLFNIQFLHDYWVSILAPVVYIENDMNIRQNNIANPGAQYPHDIIQAFNNPAWNFARIDGKKKCVQFGDVFVRMGKTYYNQDGFQLLFYGGFTIPTTKQQNPKYVFSPVAGFNGHWGIIFGAHTDFLLSDESCPWSASFFIALEALYLLQNSQCRTFDIICKPWSRYMLFVRRHGRFDEYYQGVNVLTRRVKVHPYTLADFACGWRVKSDWFEWELGYGIWGHGDEKIELKCNYNCPDCGQYGITGKPPAGYTHAVTASTSTIQHQAEYDKDEHGNPVFIGVADGQLDLLSAASRSALNHKIFMSFGHLHNGCCIDYVLGIGCYAEIPQWRTSLPSCGVWLKYSMTF